MSIIELEEMLKMKSSHLAYKCGTCLTEGHLSSPWLKPDQTLYLLFIIAALWLSVRQPWKDLWSILGLAPEPELKVTAQNHNVVADYEAKCFNLPELQVPHM